MTCELSSAVHSALLAEAAAAYPRECCGLLLGNAVRIDGWRAAENVAADPERLFEIDPATLIAAHRAARDGGPRVAGYYHSHPNGLARPSEIDAASASGDRAIWAIVAAGRVTLWRDEGTFKPLPYRRVAP